jgi:DNA helicase-2/ATP-dependent DNA helicase PcrA
MLNKEQTQAVTTPNKSALILSGAGTGKTSVLVSRLAHHLAQGVEPDAIMAVTFTNKAAAEIKSRLESQLHESLNGLWLGTFHSLCYRLLIMHLKAKFKVISQSQQISILKKLITQHELELDAKKALDFINAKKDNGLRAIESTDMFEQVYLLYQIHCKSNLLMDFGDLLLRTYELLNEYPKLLAHYQNKFAYFLVDEAQDTNFIQYEFLKLLSHGNQNLFFIGDDSQSIYSFRGAVLENLFTFQAEYPNHELIKLETNYRCTANILDAANKVIGNNTQRLQKVLRTDNPAGDKITLYTAHNDVKEAEYIAGEILKCQAKGHELQEIAILYRTNSQSDVIAQTLLESHIPFYINKGQRFYDRQEIKLAMCYLQLALDCHDNGSFDYCVNTPIRGIGIATKQKIINYASAEQLSYWQACEAMISANLLTGKALQGITDFMSVIQMLNHSIAEHSLADTLQLIIAKVGLIGWYLRNEEGQDRLDNLDELVQLASVFKGDLALELSIHEQFLAHACLSSTEEKAVGVQLMTLHGSKGLEFSTVFLVGLEQGLFPSKAADLQEERRLMYVGITRAKHRLIITHAKQRSLYGTTLYQKPSVFLTEIPSTLITTLKDKPLVTLKMPVGVKTPDYAYG